ncbi:MAG: murein biosynthesis integral membrane protein MurJ [Candidatus Moraniibacteriota bacterium]
MVAKIVRKIAYWNNASSKTIGGAALLIALSGIASRLLGFVRDRILATSFGAGDVLDAYYTAFRIPDLLYGLLVAGALSAAFVPIFTELVTKRREEEAWRLTSALLIFLLVTLGLLGLLGILFAPALTTLLAPGFGAEKKELATLLTRIMLLSPVFLGVSAVFGGVLMSFKRFLAYACAPIFYNLGIIFGALFLVPSFGAKGLAWGVVLGAFLHMAIQYPALRGTGFRVLPEHRFIWRNPAARRVIALMIPRSLSMGVSQVSLLVMTAFASTLASGSLAAFTFANNIQSVPLGLFGIAFALAVFPSLSIYAAEKEGAKFFQALCGTAQRILFFVVPLSFAMVIFRAQFVRVILGAGQFDWEDTILTFEVMKFLALSLFAQSLIPLFARAFFALQNTKTPLYIALASEAVHIALIPFLLPYFQVQALAITFSLASVLNAGLLYWYLRQKAVFWEDRAFMVPAAKIFSAAILASLVAQLSKTVFALTTNELDTFIEVFLQLIVGLLIGGGSYVFFAYLLGIHELDMVKRFVFSRLLRQPEKAVLTEDHPERGDW